MNTILFVKKKFKDSFLIWFQNSNSYFFLEEPAWYVFKKIANRHKSQTIAKNFSSRYEIGYKESLNFIKEVRHNINIYNRTKSRRKFIDKFENKIKKHVYSAYSTHRYNMQNKIIDFSFATLKLENWIHPLIKHLETKELFKEKSHFELFTFENRVIFKVDNMLKGSWKLDESPFVKGRVFVELLNALHNKTDADWLMTVHASAISDGKKTILFSASAGSGKTTFAALLKTHGYHIISDDFVPIEKSTFKAYPLPIAMSVKEGSMDLLTTHYPELDKKTYIEINPKKKIKYLPVDSQIVNMVFPVNEFVFIKYDHSVDLFIEKCEPIEALKKLFEEAWIPPAVENVEVFLDKIRSASFYNLTYSNNEMAIEAINQIFNDDKK